MTSYWQLLALILPVFAIIAIGVGVRRLGWIEEAADQSLIRLVVNLCYPCLILESVASNSALHEPGNILLPPLLGFGLTALAIFGCLQAGRAMGLTVGTGLRTFALTAGICNYGYLPLPIVGAMWPGDTKGVLLVHNVGTEAAMWTVGVLVLSGLSLREGWRKLVNPITLTLGLAIVLNLTGLGPKIPAAIMNVIHALAGCAIPLGLVMIGVSLASYLGDLRELIRPRVMLAASVMRLVIIPLVILAVARWLPCPVELKRVLVVQAAMPSGVFTIVIARHYGGQPLTAVQIVLGTTVLGILTIPLVIELGGRWVGV